MGHGAQMTLTRWVAGLWSEARADISVAWAERGVYRWCPERRALSIPSRGRDQGRVERCYPGLTQRVGALLLSSEWLTGRERGLSLELPRSLTSWGEVHPLVSSLLLSSLELGVGERWARHVRPGLRWEPAEPPPPPHGCAGWVSALWSLSEALRRCGRGDVVTYDGRLLIPTERPLELIEASPFSGRRRAELEREACARYERHAWVLSSISKELDELEGALRSAEALKLEGLSDTFSSTCPLTALTFLCEPRAYLSALDQALRWDEERASERWERARADGDEDRGEEEACGEEEECGEGLLPPEALERAIWGEVEPHLERVSSELAWVKPPERSVRKRGLYESGRRVELRALMRAEVRPDRGERVWQRSGHPQRAPQATLLLVDLSSSMRGPRLDALLEALSLVCLALARLEAPFALFGFQDELIPLLHFEQEKPQALSELIPTLTATYEEVWGARRGGHNRSQYNDDGPCLAQAVDLLRSTGASQRSLWVLSDGLPKGARSGVAELKATLKEVSKEGDIALFALGLGPDTRHVEALYPVAQGDVPLERLAEVMGALLLQRQGSLG